MGSPFTVGFTGTRDGMTYEQQGNFFEVMRSVFDFSRGMPFLHHGDCIGADEQAHTLCKALGYKRAIHPPTSNSCRAFCEGEEQFDPLPYLERDQKIVDHADVLVATPKEKAEIVRSGTWATIRKARKKKIPIYIIYPDGNVVKEHGT